MNKDVCPIEAGLMPFVKMKKEVGPSVLVLVLSEVLGIIYF